MTTATIEEKVKSMFCEVDRTHQVDKDTLEYKNHIASSYPAYMEIKQMQNLEQSVADRESALDKGAVSIEAIEYYKRQLKNEKKRLEDIKSQIPKFSQNELTHMKTEFNRLEDNVRAAKFTEMEMETMKGIDPHEESRRMSEPCIPIDKWIAESCNVGHIDSKGRCSRSEAERALKIINWHLTGGGQEGAYITSNLHRTQGGSYKSSQVSVDIDLKLMEQMRQLQEKINDLELKIKQKKG